MINLSVCTQLGLFKTAKTFDEQKAKTMFAQDSLNEFMSQGRTVWREVREVLQKAIKASALPKEAQLPISEVKLRLPFRVGDYTDFYASKEHATNVGTMFRGKDNALQPNW